MGGKMKFSWLIFYLALPWLCTAANQERELTSKDLLVEYHRLLPINLAFQQGIQLDDEKFPRHLGRFRDKSVEEIYFCGDVCPQYGVLIMSFQGIPQDECEAIGDPIYSTAWGRQYRGCSPLSVRRGQLLHKGNTWFLRGQDSASLREVPLVLDEESVCWNGSTNINCDDQMIDSRRAEVVALKRGNSLEVLQLQVTMDKPVRPDR